MFYIHVREANVEEEIVEEEGEVYLETEFFKNLHFCLAPALTASTIGPQARPQELDEQGLRVLAPAQPDAYPVVHALPQRRDQPSVRDEENACSNALKGKQFLVYFHWFLFFP
ncbi:hypothetical protein CAEBREN_12603 [Caenorhabditis brenneri]|uniref:Uncharacterized protein n=1 Tax=Caenorhabditis brenneri TaxID=135651 RepID=G0NXN1_CAEBE|nr:hypothetical protein CAEBREN_12603 [Caenorhabditis brenneri]